MSKYSMILFVALVLIFAQQSRASGEPGNVPELRVVPYVDVVRYMGTWHEIARYKNSFQKDSCINTTAQYTLRDDGKVDVLNRCQDASNAGRFEEAHGTAKVVDRQTNAKLKVTFFWPFYGKYWVIDLGPNYEYAVVGHPKRNYLWILSRTPTIDQQTYQGILSRLSEQYYDVGKLIENPGAVLRSEQE